jgi:RNA polymerase sigma-70 factor (ECF subfamily)
MESSSLLADQDRAVGGSPTDRRGTGRAREGGDATTPGRWQLHAAIAACHSDTRDGGDTDWLQVLTLTTCCWRTTARRSYG